MRFSIALNERAGFFMLTNIQRPQQRIAAAYIFVKRLTSILETIVSLIFLAVLLILSIVFPWYGWITLVLWAILGLDLLYAIWSIGISPLLLQRYWRYEVDTAFIQLQHGRFICKHQLVPMTKVQYVELEQGPFLRRYGLYTIKIGTMGSVHKIPGIPDAEAVALRKQIALHARIKEVEA